MADLWTLSELVAEAATRIAALPAPKNGQVRAIPDERTVRYYATLGLLDRPARMRGRTALYGRRHAAQVIAIKRLQTMGRSLAEIQQLWPTLDDATLARMSGVELVAAPASPGRPGFWKRDPARRVSDASGRAARDMEPRDVEPRDVEPRDVEPRGSIEVRVEIAPGVVLSLSHFEDGAAVSLADVRAIRAAAAPLLAELVSRRLAPHADPEGATS